MPGCFAAELTGPFTAAREETAAGISAGWYAAFGATEVAGFAGGAATGSGAGVGMLSKLFRAASRLLLAETFGGWFTYQYQTAAAASAKPTIAAMTF